MAKTVSPLPEGEEKVHAVGAMFDTIAPRYDLLNRLLTFRLDVGLAAPHARLARPCPRRRRARHRRRHRRPLPRDLSIAASSRSRSISPPACSANARTDAPLVQSDARFLRSRTASVDGVTCGFALRNLVDLEACFAEMARVLRPGGSLALLEVSTPTNPILAFGHRIYFGRVVPFIGGLLSDGAAYQLPAAIGGVPAADARVARA